jgi:lipoyl(octanoyl) transferase
VTGVLLASHLGPTPYREGLAIQEALVQCRAGSRQPPQAGPDWLLFPDHPPVLTMGRGGSEASLRVDRATLERLGIELFAVARGGDVTWHGPGQLVGYAVVDLARRGGDVHGFLRAIERALIGGLGRWGIEAGRVPGRTGVWVEGEKIASIGVAVRRWVSYHGFALNVAPDLGFFDLIHPCGLRGIHMTSVAARLGPRAPALGETRRVIADTIGRELGYREVRWVQADVVRGLAAASGRDGPEPSGAAPNRIQDEEAAQHERRTNALAH